MESHVRCWVGWLQVLRKFRFITWALFSFLFVFSCLSTIVWHCSNDWLQVKTVLRLIHSCFHIQEEFLKLVYRETILVGHSLENDLLALKISHNLVIDTAILYKHSRGSSHKTALRVLARRFLSQEIQQSGDGHDSIEDAKATMELALLKIRHGKYFPMLLHCIICKRKIDHLISHILLSKFPPKLGRI